MEAIGGEPRSALADCHSPETTGRSRLRRTPPTSKVQISTFRAFDRQRPTVPDGFEAEMATSRDRRNGCFASQDHPVLEAGEATGLLAKHAMPHGATQS